MIQLGSEIEKEEKKPHRIALLDKQSDPSSFRKSLAAWDGGKNAGLQMGKRDCIVITVVGSLLFFSSSAPTEQAAKQASERATLFLGGGHF